MRWLDLAFLHWAVDPNVLTSRLPTGLSLDTYEDRAWLGITPFRMSGTRPRLVPPVPLVSSFPELNVRTYVVKDNKPGVWFLSLDAANTLAVLGARWLYDLPYHRARMSCVRRGDWIHYESERRERGKCAAKFVGRYRPLGSAYHASPGSLDHWLTERYCLYTVDSKGKLQRGEIHHAPWLLQRAEAEIEINSMAHASGIAMPDEPPLVHFSQCQEVVAWYLESVEDTQPGPVKTFSESDSNSFTVKKQSEDATRRTLETS
ncbi:MAG: YqjF family protein [Pirellulaceae bacterium]